MARTEGCRDPQYSDLRASGSWNRAATAARSASGATDPSPCRWWRQTPVNRQPTSPAVGHRPRKARPTAPPKTASSCRCAPSWPRGCSPRAPHASGFGVVWLFAAVVLAAVHAPDLAPLPVHRPRARNHVRLPHHRPAALWLALALQRRAWCTSPTARATRCRAAGTGCT